jgi:RNA polymerase sigma-70 factor (ECF subfamily)
MDELTEALAQARRGSKDAFCDVVALTQAHVRAYLSRYVQAKSVVEDLAQDTFLQAYVSLRDYDPRLDFRRWLLGIARNRALSYLRGEAHRREREARAAGTSLAAWWSRHAATDEADPDLHDRELRALEACVKSLPPESAHLLDAYYIQGRTAADLARSTGKSENAVWVAMLRLRQALHRCVQGQLAGMGGA